jgi:diaminohydroxyphosphoribosylaminopyrimidine deaminase/5-amino-6-(5-phosphoribosylamino)uracil reductase
VEGGAKTLQSFLDDGLWDEARVFTSKTVLGNGIKAPILEADLKDQFLIGNDQLLIFRKHD